MHSSQVSYRDLVDAMPDVLVLVCDDELRLQVVAGGAMERLGLVPEELAGSGPDRGAAETDSRLVIDAFRAALGGERVTIDDFLSPRTGVLWRPTFVPVRDASGAVTAAMAVSRDVTERAVAVAAAFVGEERLRAALSSMLDPFVLLEAVRDDRGRIVDFVYEYANRAAAEANRVPSDDLEGRRLLELLPGHIGSGMFERYAQLVETGEPLVYDGMEYEDVWGGVRDRRVFDVRAVPVGDGLAYTWRDVTRRAALEEELARAREDIAHAYARLETVVNAVPLAIAVVDTEDRVTLWSDGAEAAFGWSKDEVLGRPLPIVPEQSHDEFEEARAKELAGQRVLGAEQTRRRNDGSTFPASIYTAPVRDVDGRLLETVRVTVDVTVQKSSERLLLDALERERRSSESRKALMWALAHDVTNPLTAIRGFAHTIQRRLGQLDDETERMLLGRISAQADRLLRLTSDLLDAARVEDSKVARSDTDLAQLLVETVAAVDHRAHPVTVEAPTIVALVDPVRLRRIIENLVFNAIRHTPAGTPVWVRAERHGEDVELSVDDAGPGIPAERRQRLFDPFERDATSGGSGLGLYLVRRFSSDMGGRVWVDERPGGGSSFKVLLPGV